MAASATARPAGEEAGGAMGSPKAARSKASQLGGIWRRRVGAPFAALLVAAVLVLVVFTGRFPQGPDGQSGFSSFLVLCTVSSCVLTGDLFQLPRGSPRYMWTTPAPGQCAIAQSPPRTKARRSNPYALQHLFSCLCLVHRFLVIVDRFPYSDLETSDSSKQEGEGSDQKNGKHSGHRKWAGFPLSY